MEFFTIYDLLHQLGITANYTGFFYTALAVSLAVQQPERLRLVTKQLYPEVAQRYGTTISLVERNIRTVTQIAWTANRPLLESLANHSLPARPTAAQFISILAACFFGKEHLRQPSHHAGDCPASA